jgi:uncharacterized protein YegL
MQTLIRDLPIGPNNVQFSVVSYGSTVQNNFYLNQYSSKRPLLDAVQKADNVGGTTQTGEALKYIREHNILAANGARSNSSLFVIVLTDGASSDKAVTAQEANLLKAAGATVVAIGIGSNVDTSELNAIASDPKHVFTTQNFDALQTIKEDVKKAACEGMMFNLFCLVLLITCNMYRMSQHICYTFNHDITSSKLKQLQRYFVNMLCISINFI